MDDTLAGAFDRAVSAATGFGLTLLTISGAGQGLQDSLDNIADSINEFRANLGELLPRISNLTQLTLGLIIAKSRLGRAIAGIGLNFFRLTGILISTRSAMAGLALVTTGLGIAIRTILPIALIEGLIFVTTYIRNLDRELQDLSLSFTQLGAVAGLNFVEAMTIQLIALPDRIFTIVRAIAGSLIELFRITAQSIGAVIVEGIKTGFGLTGDLDIPEVFSTAFDASLSRAADNINGIFAGFENRLAATSEFFGASSPILKLAGFDDAGIKRLQDASRIAAERTLQSFRDALSPSVSGDSGVSETITNLEQDFSKIGNIFDDQIVSPVKQSFSSIGRSFEDFATTAITSFSDIGDAAKQLGRTIVQELTRSLIVQPIIEGFTNLLGAGLGGSGGGGGNLLPASLSGIAAQGGGLRSGLTLVGEQGPELRDFRTPSRIYPTNVLREAFRGGGTTVNNTINIEGGGDSQDIIERFRSEAIPRLVEATKAAVAIDSGRRSSFRSAGRNIA